MADLNPLHLITRAHLSWFSQGREDARFLSRWRSLPLTYRSGQPVDGWKQHHYREYLGTAARFTQAADLLLSYTFYPPSVMHHTSDFGLASRHMHTGDRIVQRIHVIGLAGVPLCDVMTCNEVTQVVEGSERAGFTYTTTQAHSEEGEWGAYVTREGDQLWLSVDAVSRASPQEPKLIHPLMSALQKRAHRLGIAHFKERLSERHPAR